MAIKDNCLVTLINPPGVKTFSSIQMHAPNPPIGLAYIAGVLRDSRIPYKVVDAVGEGMDTITSDPRRPHMRIQGLTFEQIIERVPADTRIIGIGCMFSTLWPITRELSKHLRAHFPNALIILGGEHGTAVPESVLRTSSFDLVVRGEGVDTILDVVSVFSGHGHDRSRWCDVKGIAFLDGVGRFIDTGLSERKRDIDAIPLPDWDSITITEYIDRHQVNGANLGRSIPLVATWGCPYQCTFCSNPNMWTTQWIPRNPKRVVDEMELYMRKYGVTNFDFQDLTAMIRRSWIIQFTDEIIKRGLKITWQLPSGTRSEVFDEEIAGRLYRAGLRLLSFAPESGSARILKLVKKQVDLDKMMEAMRVAIRAGLKLSCYIVIGFPSDTPETLAETLRLVRNLALLGVHDVSVTKFVPYPGSELFKQLQAQGKLRLDDEFFIMPMEFYTNRSQSFSEAISNKRLYFTMMWMFVNFYALAMLRRPWRLFEPVIGLLTGREDTRFAKWSNDLLVVRRRWNRQLKRGDAAPAKV